MRKIVLAVFILGSALARAQEASTPIMVNTPLPSSTSQSIVDTSQKIPSTSATLPAPPATNSGAPLIPTIPSISSATPTQAPEAPSLSVPAGNLVPGMPAKVYANLGQAAAAGINPLAPAVAPPVAATPQSNDFFSYLSNVASRYGALLLWGGCAAAALFVFFILRKRRLD